MMVSSLAPDTPVLRGSNERVGQWGGGAVGVAMHQNTWMKVLGSTVPSRLRYS